MKTFYAVALATVLCPGVSAAQAAGAVDLAFDAFWDAGSVKEALKATDGIVASGASFDSVFERLADGRSYKLGAELGDVVCPPLSRGDLYPTTLIVPRSYNKAVKYPVRVYLHGGVTRPRPEEGADERRGGSQGPSARPRLTFKERYIAVYPSGYADSQWWFSNQMTNLDEILDRLKRTYNIDENRVHLMGVSDGGTGTYFVGFKNPTAWSSFFPLNGFMRVLANPATRADGEVFTTNLTNRPLYAVNGELDPLYPARAARPYLVMLQRAGGDVTFRPMAGAGHDTSWWPTEGNAIDTFEEEHPRDPYPQSLSWETERVDRYNRIAWLIVDRLATTRTDATFPNNNLVEIEEPADFGLRVDPRRGDGRKIREVISDSPAAAMGLKKGDTVVRIDDATVRTAGDIGRALDEHPPGIPLVLEVERKGRRLSMEGPFPPAPKPARKEEAFRHSKPSGRVDVLRKGNTFEAKTRGVAGFTLLLAPEVIDFEQPVKVVVNGRVAFEGAVERSVPRLLQYAARDNDRTMLFGAELPILVP